MVIDYYENPKGELLGLDLTASQAEKIINERIEDTDGECDIYVYSQLDEKELYQHYSDSYYN